MKHISLAILLCATGPALSDEVFILELEANGGSVLAGQILSDEDSVTTLSRPMDPPSAGTVEASTTLVRPDVTTKTLVPSPEATGQLQPPPDPGIKRPPKPIPKPSIQKVVEKGITVRLPDVFFNSGSHQLTSAGKTELEKVAVALKKEPNINFLIEGYTDNVGTSAENLALGQRRADAVKAALMSMGVARHRMKTVSYGEARQFTTNSNAKGRAANRRVDIVSVP